MNQDPTEPSKAPADPVLQPESATRVPPRQPAMASQDIDPLTVNAEDDEEARLPDIIDDSGEDYLYPANRFVVVEFPAAVEQKLLAAPSSVA